MRAAEALEGGINRNSSPQAITTVRNSYDRLLSKFPLLFGYWKKYADLEFSITGTEAAEMVRKPCYFPILPFFRRKSSFRRNFALSQLYTPPFSSVLSSQLCPWVLSCSALHGRSLCASWTMPLTVNDRSMREALLAFPHPSIYGPTTAPSKLKRPMMPTSFESKYLQAASLPLPCNRYRCSSPKLLWCRLCMNGYVAASSSIDDG